MRCELLAKLWLALSVQTLNAGQPDIAVSAINRSLSFKQTQTAQLFKSFLEPHQYQVLYKHLAQKQWQDARQTLVRLQVLLGDTESLRRFHELIDYLSNNPA
jgi:hypothetical protein